MVQAQLNGFLPPDFDAADMPIIDVRNPPKGRQSDFGLTDIMDARSHDDPRSEARRFAEDGFVLLQHATRVRDWDADIEEIYLPEIEGIVRNRLYPGRDIEVQQFPSLVRRGRGTGVPYAGGIHSDGPQTSEKYAANIRAFASAEAEAWWRKKYERPEVRGFVQIDFWRTTNMSEPLQHMPLALCRPDSVDRADIIPSQMLGIAPGENISNHLALRYNSKQAWRYFSAMRADEVLAFKLAEFWKDDEETPAQNVFHTAFDHPDTPADAEERQSCEHRIGVLILDDQELQQG